MHPYTMLRTIVEECSSATLFDENLQPDVFGSAWAVYRLRTTTLRLVWDGKDGLGYLQCDRNGAWDDVGPYLTETDLESAVPNHAKIELFRKAIRELPEV